MLKIQLCLSFRGLTPQLQTCVRLSAAQTCAPRRPIHMRCEAGARTCTIREHGILCLSRGLTCAACRFHPVEPSCNVAAAMQFGDARRETRINPSFLPGAMELLVSTVASSVY